MTIFGIHRIHEGFLILFAILKYRVCILEFILNKEDNFLDVSCLEIFATHSQTRGFDHLKTGGFP